MGVQGVIRLSRRSSTRHLDDLRDESSSFLLGAPESVIPKRRHHDLGTFANVGFDGRQTQEMRENCLARGDVILYGGHHLGKVDYVDVEAHLSAFHEGSLLTSIIRPALG